MKEAKETSYFDLATELMIFRTAYLQLIAESWSDENILKDYLIPVDLGNTWRGRVGEDVNFLEAEAGQYSAMDEVIGKKRKRRTYSPKVAASKNLLNCPDFKKYLPPGFNFNWHLDAFLVDTCQTVYNPFNTTTSNGWEGTSDIMVIKIPEKPRCPEEYHAEALMAYYAIFTTIFGTGPTSSTSSEFGTGGINIENLINYFLPLEKHEINLLETLAVDIQSQMGDGGPTSFLAFSGAIIQIIAAAWSDPEYMEFLVKQFILTPMGTPGAVYKDKFISFSNPWGFTVKFEIALGSDWENEKKKWVGLEKNQIFLCYPRPHKLQRDYGGYTFKKCESQPTWDPHKWSMALARYNDTGPAYPFTCW